MIRALATFLMSRARKEPVKMIVLHATAGGSASGAISTLRLRGLSYHAIISDQREVDGETIKCVPDSRVAFHAGASQGPYGSNVNRYTLGASFVNLNDGKDPYSAKQVEAMLSRCVSWCLAYPTITHLSTHYWVSPGRKNDPKNGPGFDIVSFHIELNRRLAKSGHGGVRLFRSSS